MQIYFSLRTAMDFADPEIAGLPSAQKLVVVAQHIGVAWTYDTRRRWRCWWSGDLAALWEALRGRTIIGWDVEDFMVPLLQLAVGAPKRGEHTTFDLFAFLRMRTGRWYTLEEVSIANLSRSALGDAQQAAKWLRSGEPALHEQAARACQQDIQLVQELFAHAAGAGLLLPPRNTGRREAPETFRLWIDEAGGAWRLCDAATGQLIDEGAHWS